MSNMPEVQIIHVRNGTRWSGHRIVVTENAVSGSEAIRRPGRGKAHRPLGPTGMAAICAPHAAKWSGMERVPLSDVPPADRCKTCWKDRP